MQKETYRLSAMKRYLQLNLRLEKKLDDLVMLASHITKTPVAFITLMDEEVQWITTNYGYEVEQMPRSTSFCTHTIEQEDVLEVPDTYLDDRFKQNPIVNANPAARFYAGVPLKSYDGYNVGTLCVLDVKPNNLDDAQRDCLKALTRQASNIIELKLGFEMVSKSIATIEEKKTTLEKQNDQLKKIAQIQSHEFRGPLCSVMSLMNLIKMEDYKTNKDYLVLMESAVKQLDEKIGSVVRITAEA